MSLAAKRNIPGLPLLAAIQNNQRLTRSSPDSLAATLAGATVHVARPTRSILRFAQNDIIGRLIE